VNSSLENLTVCIYPLVRPMNATLGTGGKHVLTVCSCKKTLCNWTVAAFHFHA